MGIEIVRTPSETPNITNVDDIIPMRYAYGNQDGYVIGRGTELAGTYESGTFTVGSGRAVIQGVEVKIDANGESTSLNTATETRYYHIYLQVNLNSNTVGLVNYYSTSSYDDIYKPQSADLLDNGTAYLLLHSIKLNGSTEAEKTKLVQPIYYYSRKLLWTGNAEIGTTNPSGTLTSFAKIPEKENTMYEIHGEITEDGTRRTFVIYMQVGVHHEYGYKTSQIVDTWFTSTLMQYATVEIHRGGDFFFGRALRPTIYFSNHSLAYNGISASITKIYEIN